MDIESLYRANTANNVASSPTRLSCSSTARTPIPDDVHHKIDYFFDNLERFDDAEDFNLPINERPTLTNRDTEMEIQVQSTITRPTTDLRDFLAHWAIQNKLPQSVMNDLLKGLQKFGHPDLPSDARILCPVIHQTELIYRFSLEALTFIMV